MVMKGSPTGDRVGLSTQPVPERLHPCKYALVLRSLRKVTEEVDLGAYEVAIGPKEGTPLASYLRGRVDKACARLASIPRSSDRLKVVLRAELVAPYAVVLKTI